MNPCDNSEGSPEDIMAILAAHREDLTSFGVKSLALFGFAARGEAGPESDDFVASLADGSYNLIETKGREDIDVAHKDRAPQIWCENATLLIGIEWRYLKVPQLEFNKLRPVGYADLLMLTRRRPKGPRRLAHSS